MKTIQEIKELDQWVKRNRDGVVLRKTINMKRLHHASCPYLVIDYVKREKQRKLKPAAKPTFHCYSANETDAVTGRWCLTCNIEKYAMNKQDL